MNERRLDFELLQRFTRQGEQSAFADVVQRHLDLVFATALRKVEDAGAAQEAAQNVFTALARKAWRFAPDDSLPAWLHKTTLLESKSWLRGELGRRRREQTAAELGTTMNTPADQPAFHALVPLLHGATLSRPAVSNREGSGRAAAHRFGLSLVSFCRYSGTHERRNLHPRTRTGRRSPGGGGIAPARLRGVAPARGAQDGQ